MKKVILPIALGVSVFLNAVQYDSNSVLNKLIAKQGNEISELKKEYENSFKEKLKFEAELVTKKHELEKKEVYIKLLQDKVSELKKSNELISVSRGYSDVKKSIYVTATAYTSFCDSGCIGKTATGHDVSNTTLFEGRKIIAVDPSVIPLNSIVRVYPKDREPFIAIAKDTGGRIKGSKIDFLISVHDTSLADKFGKQQNVLVEILR